MKTISLYFTIFMLFIGAFFPNTSKTSESNHLAPQSIIQSRNQDYFFQPYHFMHLGKYRVEVDREIDEYFNVPRFKVAIFGLDGEKTGKGVSYLVDAEHQTIFIENFYPNLPKDKKGNGRELLRTLILRQEYVGYKVIAIASDSFQRSFQKLDDFKPIVGNHDLIYQEVGRHVLAQLEREVNTHNPRWVEKLKDLWYFADLFGTVPEIFSLNRESIVPAIQSLKMAA